MSQTPVIPPECSDNTKPDTMLLFITTEILITAVNNVESISYWAGSLCSVSAPECLYFSLTAVFKIQNLYCHISHSEAVVGHETLKSEAPPAKLKQ